MSEEQQLTHLEPATATSAPGTITLRLPKFNWQIGALILIAVVAGFQTFQLARLKGSVSVKSAVAAPAASSAPAAGGSDNGLQGMVGGC
ncbi:hypothetical protein A3B21_01400 [Candidatus Uhrbacteria bacterium RIFCSPLOWO2_01_FULL_47_24]|uniref:Uncharacterized protein n=1 Tax=Candidatus Uhrbacteria bacterium RIFCSPLOWO2_01_FULL_47_24 TaxID=1802401 RepID=A0A1F7UNR2_9BACT|nr:MAG: hypothetical protein A2753_01425 [Candidatus Uhrbacteria bacterium RIFCSPHIGHO2_01_FULL_47_11]OGL67629.1 MAG: hypothetical protein A3D58_02775 [Candidatus Uhrbacteria bacterium RIFCSPHIGHO2_02_FULL_46_47]OGL76707.1 MAG: hypothetical protein A3F52_00400 [Candidatus Uhrbacteria bacterium RIFCSPHIGHO2_12_FULL_47_11]OGL79933.1 MAG: hypothetical protein A3B21_01400 [Candidatus Uhrbacteria bacterium RIFCSPLOWO2_01_FULL_47_24]OGL84190.1 MAG: hypothetical protein A3J03_01995 [Candidatus Uhrbact